MSFSYYSKLSILFTENLDIPTDSFIVYYHVDIPCRHTMQTYNADIQCRHTMQTYYADMYTITGAKLILYPER